MGSVAQTAAWWWVRGRCHLHDLLEGYRTRTPGAHMGIKAGGWVDRVRPGTSHGRALPGRGDGAPAPRWLRSTMASRQREGITTPATSPARTGNCRHDNQARRVLGLRRSTPERHSGRSGHANLHASIDSTRNVSKTRSDQQAVAPLVHKTSLGFGLIATALCVCACSASSSEPFAGSSTDVSEATWNHGTWPLTVSRGVLGCTVPNQITFNNSGTLYGLNGTAMDHGLPPIDPIWKPDGDARADIGPMIDEGMKLCNPPSTAPAP